MFRFSTAAGILVTLTSLVGCGPKDEIRTYTVPKEKSRVSVAETQPENAEPTDRMLVAVVPHGDQASFFKLIGPIPQVDSVAGEVKKFVESLELNGDDPPTWELPEGWREEPGNQFRRATLVVPANDKSLELAVSELPWQTSDAYLLSNVNRWRGQLGLAPVNSAKLKESVETLELGDEDALWIDLKGRSSGPSMAPFAGGGTRPAPPVEQKPADPETPFAQETPEGWIAKPAGGLRKAEFQVGEGPQAATVTVFDFSKNAPQMASPIANIDRWRGEIGLPPLDESELDKTAKQVTISGQKGISVEMESPEGHEPLEATLAAMMEMDNRVWFFKLRGPRDTVLPERERFQQWLDSIQFRSTANEN